MNKQKFIIIFFLLIGIPTILFFITLSKQQDTGLEVSPTPTSTKQTRPIVIRNISPTNGGIIGQTESIILSFEELPSETISFSFNPEVDGTFRTDTIKGQFVFIPRIGFLPSTTYQATIAMQSPFTIAPDTQKRTSYTWSFTTGEQEGETGFTEADAAAYMEQRTAAENAYADRKKKYPFIEYVPYITTHYKVEIMSTADTVIVTTFGRTQTEITQYQNEAKAWLTANGGKLETLNIQYRNQAQ